MAPPALVDALLPALLLSSLSAGSGQPIGIPVAPPPPVNFTEAQLFQLALNLEYLEAEFYLHAAYGKGVEGFNPSLTGGGPPSEGGRKAQLSPDVQKIAEMLGLQEIGHIRTFREFLGPNAIPRPNISISIETWTAFAKQALGPGAPPFDPYVDDLNFLIASFVLPYVGLTAYVGTNRFLVTPDAKSLLGGVLGIEAGQDAMLRTLLWTRRREFAVRIGQPVLKVTGGITQARNKLAKSGQVDDENIEVPKKLGAENLTSTNILAGNAVSLSYARNPAETLRIVYGTGNASQPGGFFPSKANGGIPEYYLSHPDTSP